ncbi:hypothetical protein [Ottowia sp. VDI28]|uniref:hypothetical protein n=1 Tax=Ottowia sp. VDI28 TaxID=3133968 RepID=UPI003C2F576D
MKLKYAMNTAARPLGALLLALLAAGCAAPAPGGSSAAAASSVAAAPAAAPQISVPPASIGTWYDLGTDPAPWLGGEGLVPVSGATAPTRAVGLQREDGHWLAVVVVQAAAANGGPVCPQADSMHLAGGNASDCLRMRRDADLDHWLKAQHAMLWQWLEKRNLASTPRAWVGHRISAGGRLLEVHALVDPALIESVTRNNTDFLAAGEPGQRWAQALAAASRAAAGGAALAVPPFPYMPQVAPPPPPPAVTIPTPARAIQVPSSDAKPPALAPRRDRE